MLFAHSLTETGPYIIFNSFFFIKMLPDLSSLILITILWSSSDYSYFMDEEMKVQRGPEQWAGMKRRLLGKAPLRFSPAPSLLPHFASNTRCVGFSHIRQSSATPARYATVHFWHYSELVQTLQVIGSIPHDCPQQLQTMIKSSMSPGYPQSLSDLAANRRFPWPLPWVPSFARRVHKTHTRDHRWHHRNTARLQAKRCCSV